MLSLFVILAVTLQIAISIGVYFRRRGGSTNKVFMFLSLALAGWAFTNYIAITIHQDSTTIYAIRTVLSFVVIENILFFLFAKTYPNHLIRDLSNKAKAVIVYSLFVLALTQTPLVFGSISIKNGTANPNPKPLIILFVLQAAITIFGGLRALFKNYFNAKNIQKRQLAYIIIASTILWLVVPVTNFAITLSAKTTIFVKFSPFYTLAFGAFITYAIAAQKLFNIGAAVARSVAYVLLLATITLIYSFGIYGVIDVIFKGSNHVFLRQVSSGVLITVLAFSFQWFRQFFNRLTNTIFYRDGYDSQTVIDELSHAIVSEIDLDTLLGNTRKILTKSINCSFIEFILFKQDNKPEFRAVQNKELSNHTEEISEALKIQRKDILTAEEMAEHNQLRAYFEHNNIVLSLRLKTQKQIIGYLMFGEKKSGDIYTNQDTKLLMIAGNELAVAVQNAIRFEEIQTFNRTLQEKVDIATHQLRRANDRLKALDETKDDFISMASHQLRTPLTSVKGYISMVLEGDAGKLSSNQRKFLSQAFSSSQKMVYLISDLLNVSRLKTGKFVIERAPTNLADVITDEIGQLKESAATRHLEFNYHKPEEFPVLNIDETKTRQVIMNFMDNALYYTPSGGHIDINLTDKPKAIEFTVTDTGIGVPKAEQHHLFTKFYRAGNARKARPDGTGLGLFMAKKVVIAQGGSIIFHTQEGKGSTFGFSLPKEHILANNTNK